MEAEKGKLLFDGVISQKLNLQATAKFSVSPDHKSKTLGKKNSLTFHI